MLVLMLILMLGVNGAIETNVLLSSNNARVNADAWCERAISDLLGNRQILLKFLHGALGT